MYTTAIAVTCALAATIIVAGAFESKLFGGPLMWAGLSCAFSYSLACAAAHGRVKRGDYVFIGMYLTDCDDEKHMLHNVW